MSTMSPATTRHVPGVSALGQRKFLALNTTILLFLLAYTLGAAAFPGMREGQAFFNLFVTTPFLLICAVGETFVIISGGIDLSVSGIIALTTTASAALLVAGWDPWLVMALMLVMGVVFGMVMGFFIAYLKVQPFIATLAGMWLARGLCYIISDSEIRIYDPVYKLLSGTRILIPGLSDPSTKSGPYITVSVVAALLVLAVGLYLAHFTRFGRTVYSMGGNNGANEQSARLMGLPVDRTKVLVYALSGFCSALAGITYSIYVGSGHGSHAMGFELTVIAAVVIGGTALTGGEGFLAGSLFGVLITAVIQALILFNGTLSSWWTSIVIGALMLVFIGVQSLLPTTSSGAGLRVRLTHATRARVAGVRGFGRRQTVYLSLAVVVAVASTGMLMFGGNSIDTNNSNGPGGQCTLSSPRPGQAQSLATAGAVIVLTRDGGTDCRNDLYAVYADGKVTADDGKTTVSKQLAATDVDALLKKIADYGWFTPDMYSTVHKPCAACYSYLTIVTYQGQSKPVTAVDGGTDTPPNYWPIVGMLLGVMPTSR